MFVKSMTWYIDPAAPCATPTVAFRYRVAQAGVPAAPRLPGEDEPGEASVGGGDADEAGAAAGGDDAGDDATPVEGVRLAAVDDEDAHPVAKAATAINPAVAVSLVRCSVIVASPLCGVLAVAEFHRFAGPERPGPFRGSQRTRAVSRVPKGPGNSKTPPDLLWLAGDYVSFATGMR